MATSIYGNMTPHSRHSHVVFDVASCLLNLSNVNTGRPCLEVGDIVVMDNLSSHHYEGGEILEEWFDTMGIELLYTPSYSPDLNPGE